MRDAVLFRRVVGAGHHLIGQGNFPRLSGKVLMQTAAAAAMPQAGQAPDVEGPEIVAVGCTVYVCAEVNK